MQAGCKRIAVMLILLFVELTEARGLVNTCSSYSHIYTVEYLIHGITFCPEHNVRENRGAHAPILQKEVVQKNESAVKSTKLKTIVFWTWFFGMPDYEFGLGQTPFVEAGCPVSNCIATSDKTHYEDAAAIVFHLRNVNHQTVFPEHRYPNQSYVFFLKENPYHQWNDLAQFNGVFNLTMTYRHDSDVPCLYGKTMPKTKEKDKNDKMDQEKLHKMRVNEVTEGKDRLIAWFVSNCGPTNTRREEYVSIIS
jgi:hypothetical protein